MIYSICWSNLQKLTCHFRPSSSNDAQTHSKKCQKILQIFWSVLIKCSMCDGEKHPLYACAGFKSLPHEAKLSLLKSNNLCSNTLSSGHFWRPCVSVHKCNVCQKPNNMLLHLGQQRTFFLSTLFYYPCSELLFRMELQWAHLIMWVITAVQMLMKALKCYYKCSALQALAIVRIDVIHSMYSSHRNEWSRGRSNGAGNNYIYGWTRVQLTSASSMDVYKHMANWKTSVGSI